MKKGVAARLQRAFTLVELLVVIGIIAILLSLLLPALAKAREQAIRTQCASNMHQWAIGLTAYAATWRGYFPPNLDGNDISWIGKDMQTFSKSYLMPLTGFKTDKAGENQDHVMYCPTQLWHRYVRDNWAPGAQELVGYFYMPHRSVTTNNSWDDYTPAGIPWVTKTKFYNNGARNAPILSDMIQSAGTSWGGPVPYSSHIDKNGVPKGGNFMFEDGHVLWYRLDEVQVGMIEPGWLFWYKIKIDP